MVNDEQDKTDPASAYKLQKARERGTAAKSQDLTYLVILFGTTCCVFGMGASATQDFARLAATTLGQASQPFWDVAALSHLIGQLVMAVTRILAPPMAVIMVLAVVTGLAQVGVGLSAEPLKPDFNRINPATGLKRLFSMRTIYELGRSALKLVAVALLVVFAGTGLLKELVVLSSREVPSVLSYMIHTVGWLLALLTALFAVLAMGDMAYTRWEFSKQMRMSKREVKDEHKQREGDPRIKSRIRELRMEWLQKGVAMRRVKDADVLITNPTHLAIAIGYKRGKMPAPQILAKGAGSLAQHMRQLAYQHQVVVVQNPPLAQALYRSTQPNDYLPQEHYADVAKILVWVFAGRNTRTTQKSG